MATKNLGQVSGIHIGSSAPSNVVLIWYDNTPNQNRHKIYDPNLGQWVPLEQTVISSTTYSELVNAAKSSGLTIGEWFKITDKGNVLALSITSTKVQYCDAIGNILIDDLGTNIQYHVTSSNLQIDDVSGVFDEDNKKLVFQFKEQTPELSDNYYILGKKNDSGIFSLIKYKISSFLSKSTNNSLSWNGGFFFSFSNAINGIIDKVGGVVGKDSYDKDMKNIAVSINNVGKDNQQIIKDTEQKIKDATTSQKIYNSSLPSINIEGEAIDIAKGDTLLNIVSKIQRYINKFKRADGIKISEDFNSNNNSGKVNNNDTVETAIEKLCFSLQNLFGDGINISKEEFKDLESEPSDITNKDTIYNAVQKLYYLIKHIKTEFVLEGAVTNDKIANNTITVDKINNNNFNLFAAVQLIVTSNVDVYSSSLIFYNQTTESSVVWGDDIPAFLPMTDGSFFNNITGVINSNEAYKDSPRELSGFGFIYLFNRSSLKARFVLNLRATGVTSTTAYITPKIVFSDGRSNEYQKILAYENHNTNAKSNYLTADFNLNSNVYNSNGFKIWIKVESNNA